jgi:hypothetical protein
MEPGAGRASLKCRVWLWFGLRVIRRSDPGFGVPGVGFRPDPSVFFGDCESGSVASLDAQDNSGGFLGAGVCASMGRVLGGVGPEVCPWRRRVVV